MRTKAAPDATTSVIPVTGPSPVGSPADQAISSVVVASAGFALGEADGAVEGVGMGDVRAVDAAAGDGTCVGIVGLGVTAAGD